MRHANEKMSGGEWVFDEEKARRNFEKAHLDDGVVRWNSNNSVPFPDMLADFRLLGLIDEATENRSCRARNADIDRFTTEYKKQSRQLSGEALAEARANFPKGTVLVDVLSGVRTRL